MVRKTRGSRNGPLNVFLIKYHDLTPSSVALPSVLRALNTMSPSFIAIQCKEPFYSENEVKGHLGSWEVKHAYLYQMIYATVIGHCHQVSSQSRVRNLYIQKMGSKVTWGHERSHIFISQGRLQLVIIVTKFHCNPESGTHTNLNYG